MNVRTFPLLAGLVLSLCTAAVYADVQAGDKPSLSFKEFTSHKTISLADLHGKIVVIDFWATWCGPCMAEAGHMVEVNQKYADKGFQFVGISLDSDPSALKPVMTEKKFTWPMSYEGAGWDGKIPKAFGVTGIPQTFIVGPDGTVLWRGHPSQIDEPLAKAFKEHPPQLIDPKTLESAKATLSQVEKAIDDKQPSKALKLLATVPESARQDGEIASRSKEISDKLQDFGNSELAGIDPLIQSSQYAAAIQKLRDLSTAFAGTPVASAAKTKLNALGSDPKVQKALEADRMGKESSDALAAANKLKADKKDDQAYPRFQLIVKSYPNTPAATEAAAAVKAYEADNVFITRYNAKTNGAKAKSLLSMGDTYRDSGNAQMAKKKYQEVIDQFPKTEWASTAAKAIAALGN